MRSSHNETHRQGHDSCTEQSKYQKYQTNCGYKHNGTTHVVKTFIYGHDVSYAPAYIFRSNVYLNYN